jgi:hypothetical protein
MLCLLFAAGGGICFAEEPGEREGAVKSRAGVTFYASTRGEMQVNVLSQWKFPFLQGDSPLTADSSVVLKLDAALSPIRAGLTGEAVLTVFPFLAFTAGAMAGTGWNYDLFGKVPLAGLGLNRRTGADDPSDGVMGNGFDGAVWDVHAGATVQLDLAAFFPGDWNHVVMRFYNKTEYLAYTKAKGDALWYYLGDDGMNMNAFRHSFDLFAGYAPPLFADLIGYQLSGTLPFYNAAAGSGIRDRGYALTHAFIVNFNINKSWSIMTVARVTNGFKDPITGAYEREWGFDRVQFIAAWHVK